MQTKKRPSPLVKGLPLISYFSGLRSNQKAVMKPTTLRLTKNMEVPAILYHPSHKDPSELPGIFLPHGMSILGIDDVRIQNLSKNLALSGYSVITPDIEEVRNLRIEEGTIQKNITLFLDFLKRTDLHLTDRVSFFSMSFSGSMGMISFAQPEVRDMIRSSMVIGSYCDFLDTYEFAIENFEVDNYAGLILFANFLRHMDKKLQEELVPVLMQYAIDNALYRSGQDAHGPKAHADLKPSTREFLYSILNDKNFRTEIVQSIRECIPVALIKSLSPYFHLGGFRAPLSLLHGTTDPVIAPVESIKIHRNLTNRNHPVNLEVSNLITHGDQVPLHSQVKGVPGVTRAFGYYFSWI